MSATRQFEIAKSTDEFFDYTVEVVIQDPKATPYTFASAVVTAVDDDDDVTDRTSEVIDAARTSVSGNKITFGVKGGTSGKEYIIKATGTTVDNQKRSAWGTLIVNDPLD